jgi:hypothetical protein
MLKNQIKKKIKLGDQNKKIKGPKKLSKTLYESIVFHLYETLLMPLREFLFNFNENFIFFI